MNKIGLSICMIFLVGMIIVPLDDPNYFVIIYPSEGDVLYQGNTYTITWKIYGSGHSEDCKLLLCQDGEQVGSITVLTSLSDREYKWELSGSFGRFIGNNYQIRIVDREYESISGISGSFSIEKSPPEPFEFPVIEFSTIVALIVSVAIAWVVYDSTHGKHWLIRKIYNLKEKIRNKQIKKSINNLKEKIGNEQIKKSIKKARNESKKVSKLKHNPKVRNDKKNS